MKNKSLKFNTYDLLDDLLDEFAEAVLRILQVDVINELCDDFRVRFRLKVISLQLQELLNVLVVGHDTIVHHHKRIAGVRPVRMRVRLWRGSVRGPAGVCDSDVGRAELCLQILVLEFCVWKVGRKKFTTRNV